MVSDNQSIRLLKKLLKLSGQNIDQETAAKLLISHPSYPSLEAFTEVMEYFGIPNEAFLMDYDSLAHTEMPLLLHLEIQGGVFVLLLSIHKRSLRVYIPESDKIIDIPKEAFLAKWSGVVFRIEKKAKKVPDLLTLRSVARTAGITCLLLLFTWFIFLSHSSPLWICAVTINLAGALTSLWIIYHETGSSNSLSRKVCHLSPKTDCEAVLSSPAAKIAGIISMGDIGSIYFSGCLLIGLFLPLIHSPQAAIHLLFYLSVFTLPYTLFSLYYQKFRVRKWCPFCLLSILLLWSAFACYYTLYLPGFYTTASLYLFIGVFGIVVSAWALFRTKLNVTKRLFTLDMELLKMKRDPAIWSLLVDKQRSYQMAFDEEDIQLGTLSSPIRITTLISDDCMHCRKVVQEMLDCIQKHPMQINWTIRFGNLHRALEKIRFANHFYYLYHNQKEYFLSALQDWAHQMDDYTWRQKYKLSPESPKSLFPESKKNWIISNQFSRVPMVFLNDKELPVPYKITDLTFLLINEELTSILTD